MDLFRSDKAPYVIGLLLTLLGWHISQLADDVRSGTAVAYRVDTDSGAGTIRVMLHNVSKTKSVAGATFALACQLGESCLTDAPPSIKNHPPTVVPSSDIRAGDSAIIIDTTLAAGGKFEFGGRLSGVGGGPRFFFVPDAEKPLDIYVFDATSPRGWFIVNYFTVLAISFMLLLVLLVISCVLLWRLPKESAPPAATAGPEGPPRAAGPPGPQGSPGAQGPPGPRGAATEAVGIERN